MKQNKLLIGLAGLLVLLILFGWYMVTPWPLQVRVAGVGSHSFSVGWLTDRAANNCVVVVQVSGGWKWQRVCETGSNRTHLVQFQDMSENQTYYVMLTSGNRWYVHTIKRLKTFVVDPTPRGPSPCYGSVIDVSGNPIPQALVYVYPRSEGKIYPEVARANDQGNFAVDLGIYGEGISSWVVEGGAGLRQWGAMVVPAGVLTPMPPLEVSVHE